MIKDCTGAVPDSSNCKFEMAAESDGANYWLSPFGRDNTDRSHTYMGFSSRGRCYADELASWKTGPGRTQDRITCGAVSQLDNKNACESVIAFDDDNTGRRACVYNNSFGQDIERGSVDSTTPWVQPDIRCGGGMYFGAISASEVSQCVNVTQNPNQLAEAIDATVLPGEFLAPIETEDACTAQSGRWITGPTAFIPPVSEVTDNTLYELRGCSQDCTHPDSIKSGQERLDTRTHSGMVVVSEDCTLTLGTALEEAAAATTCTLTSADAAATPAVPGSCAVATGSGGCAYVAGGTLSSGQFDVKVKCLDGYAPDPSSGMTQETMTELMTPEGSLATACPGDQNNLDYILPGKCKKTCELPTWGGTATGTSGNDRTAIGSSNNDRGPLSDRLADYPGFNFQLLGVPSDPVTGSWLLPHSGEEEHIAGEVSCNSGYSTPSGHIFVKDSICTDVSGYKPTTITALVGRHDQIHIPFQTQPVMDDMILDITNETDDVGTQGCISDCIFPDTQSTYHWDISGVSITPDNTTDTKPYTLANQSSFHWGTPPQGPTCPTGYETGPGSVGGVAGIEMCGNLPGHLSPAVTDIYKSSRVNYGITGCYPECADVNTEICINYKTERPIDISGMTPDVTEACAITLGNAAEESAVATSCTLTAADATTAGSCALSAGSGSCSYVAPVTSGSVAASEWRTEMGRMLTEGTSFGQPDSEPMSEKNISFVRRQVLNNTEWTPTVGSDSWQFEGQGKEIFEWQIKCSTVAPAPTGQALCKSSEDPDRPGINLTTLLGPDGLPPPTVQGCTDSTAHNYNSLANVNDGSCVATVPGCMTVGADNYNASANVDDGSCRITGCMDSTAHNYNPLANTPDNDSCVATVPGCMAAGADNYNASANFDDDSCRIAGCMESTAHNYNPLANTPDNDSCVPIVQGCMTVGADNYNTSANVDDGSCNIDCVGQWSECTAACEVGGARVWVEGTAQSGAGAACPAGPAPDCAAGADGDACSQTRWRATRDPPWPEYEFVIGKAGVTSCNETCALNTDYENTTCVNNQPVFDWLPAEWGARASNISDIIAEAKEVNIDNTILSGADKTRIQCSDISEVGGASLINWTRLYGVGAGYPFIGTAVPGTTAASVIMGRPVDDLENGRCYVAASPLNRCELTGSSDDWPASRRRICKCGTEP